MKEWLKVFGIAAISIGAVIFLLSLGYKTAMDDFRTTLTAEVRKAKMEALDDRVDELVKQSLGKDNSMKSAFLSVKTPEGFEVKYQVLLERTGDKLEIPPIHFPDPVKK